jgi:serine/threonine protein kinase
VHGDINWVSSSRLNTLPHDQADCYLSLSFQVNIFVDESGSAQVADFGLSIFSEAGSGGTTTTYTGKGTVAWMSPERISGPASRLTPPMDVYSFGILCLSVCGVLASAPVSCLRLRTQICIRARPFPQSFNDFKIVLEVSQGFRPQRPGDDVVDDSLWELIDRCWAQDPLARPRMSEVLHHFFLLTRPLWNNSERVPHSPMDEPMEDVFPFKQTSARQDEDESWVHDSCECTRNNSIFPVKPLV